ncbi:MAG TPA: ABC transporter [Cyanobacteria bacterium UBA8530]|nr:ABC transporter [Cyanobacteria bacterium UBA8530]
MKAALIIWYRDILLFFGDKPRIVGALGQPLLYLLVMGNGLAPSMSRGLGGSYLVFMFPGVIGMTVLFTSVFSAISVIWDREFGFLKEILVSPVPRPAIALGKILGGASVAFLQGCAILLLAPLVGVSIPLTSLPSILGMMGLGACALTAFGLVVASRMESMQGFQLIMNFLLLPMFFLSGALYPLSNVPPWMRNLALVDPLTYAVDGLRAAMGSPHAMHPFWLDAGILFFVMLTFMGLAVAAFSLHE